MNEKLLYQQSAGDIDKRNAIKRDCNVNARTRQISTSN